MKLSILFFTVSLAAPLDTIKFSKTPYEETVPGEREANKQETQIENQLKTLRKSWGEIDTLYREVLGANTDQVIPFRNGEFRPIGNVVMNIVSGEPTTEMKRKAIIAAERGALMTFPKDKLPKDLEK